MKLVYLPSTHEDIRWIRRYYDDVFPEGRIKFREQFYSLEKLLKANPEMGRMSKYGEAVREINIPKTPFKFYYRVTISRVEILRVWDSRQDKNKLRL